MPDGTKPDADLKSPGSDIHMDHAKKVHADQARRVADSFMHDRHGTGHEVYRRRLLGGVAATSIREAVRTAVVESLKSPNRSYEDAADAGALAADHALAQVGIEVERVGFQRQGWRGRLAHVEALLSEAEGGCPQNGDAVRCVRDSLLELRAMIDGIYES